MVANAVALALNAGQRSFACVRTHNRLKGKPSALVCCFVLAAMHCSSSLASQAVEPSINSELRKHSAHFEKEIYKIGSNVHSAVGWGLANIIMIEGVDGIVIVDTGEDVDSSREVYAELRALTDKPLKAIIYTHFHPDHIGGVKAFTSTAEVQAGGVSVIAHRTLLDNVINQGSRISPILGMRTGYTSGVFLEPADLDGMNLGIGPMPNVGRGSFIAPTVTYESAKTLTIAGTKMELRHVPSEAPDETAVFLPDENILLSGEAIQGPTLPNIHTLRGTKYRDPVTWYKSIDILRDYEADYLVPSHGKPVYGRDNVEEVLRMTRDGIQFIHDQTVRYMNRGLTPDELVEKVALPPDLANYAPYLREFYGTVKHSVRQIYQGYLGWFDGDPVSLDPTPRRAAANRLITLMGGSDAVFAEAEAAYDAADYQWAAELATLLIRVDFQNMDARSLKAAGFRQLAYAQLNSNWRNWYLTSARELEGSLDVGAVQQRLVRAMSSPDVLSALPVGNLIENLSVRLASENVAGGRALVAFSLTDTKQSYALELRNGIAEFHAQPIENPDAKFILTRNALLKLLSGQMTVEDGQRNGEIRLAGDEALLHDFFDYFDPLQPINLTVR